MPGLLFYIYSFKTGYEKNVSFVRFFAEHNVTVCQYVL
jgi:hypothetical protein